MQLTVRDAARLLNVSEKTVYRWIKQEVVPAYRLGDQYRFNRAELLEWATSRRIPLSPDIFREDDQGRTPLPTVLEALREGGVVYRVGGTDKPAVLRAVVDVLRLSEEVDREFLYQVLMAREMLGSTGIGDGIAIPHVRNPIVLHVTRPMITLCFLDHPVDFGAIDRQPVNVLFTLISPTVRAHLHMLSWLGFILQNNDVKAVLKRQGSRDQIMAAVAAAQAAMHDVEGGGMASADAPPAAGPASRPAQPTTSLT